MNAKNIQQRIRRGQAGFTAAELAAVAAIIAILSLIVVPIFRDRVDEAKRVGTLDDMQGMAKAQLLVKADTGSYVRLNDLDNPALLLNDPPISPQEVPIATTRERFVGTRRTAFSNTWQGPYVAFQNHITLLDLLSFTDTVTMTTTTLANQFGPIVIYDDAGGSLAPSAGQPAGGPFLDFEDDRYPTDHYGNPYVFRPPSSDLPPTGLAFYGVTNETTFGNAFIYSMGPNGQPGDGPISYPPGVMEGNADARDNPFYEESGVIGNLASDDLKYVF